MIDTIQAAQVDKLNHITIAEFEGEYLQGAGKPLIVKGATDHWAARRWSFDMFRRRYGNDVVIATDRLGKPKVARKVLLSEFLDYIEDPKSSPLSQIPSPRPLYMNHFSPFVTHPELLKDFEDPYFIKNIFRELSGAQADWYNQEFGWVFIGPAGTVSPLHRDLFSTHAWLTQIVGRKRITLFPPSDREFLEGDELDPLNPDLDNFPNFPKATPYDVVLEPGEVLFIPSEWFHHVVSLDPSITLTFNFITQSNVASHLMSIVRDLPVWTRKVDKANLRESLDVRWTCNGWS